MVAAVGRARLLLNYRAKLAERAPRIRANSLSGHTISRKAWRHCGRLRWEGATTSPGWRDRRHPDEQAGLRTAAPQGEVWPADDLHRSRHGHGDDH